VVYLLPVALGSVCTGNNISPNWYGAVGYPPWFTNDSSENCPQKYSLSRCEQSAVMKDGTSNFTISDTGDEVCKPNGDCSPTKQNCNDTLVCSDLVQLKDELAQGGYNIICRHEKTYWSQYTGEAKNCHVNVNCLHPDVKATQRQLQPLGWQSAYNFAKAFREMGIPIDKTYSSPFSRCTEHAEVFSDEPNEPLIELLYMSVWKEILELNNITDIVQLNALKWQAYSIRNLAGKKPSLGKNTVMVTHGFNIKLAFGTAVDEGYCMVFKPEDSLPSLADSIGSYTVGNKVFNFANDSYPVDAIARMSPEAALAMQTCDDVRSDARNGGEGVLAEVDTDYDMKITKDEFTSAYGSSANAEDAFDFISSVVIQPELLGKSKNESLIELGQFFHINWGWREWFTTGGDVAYPWRSIIENTIGPLGGSTPESRVTAFKKSNFVLSSLITELKDDAKYPSKVEMEEKLIHCNVNQFYSMEINQCFAQVSSGGEGYIPVGPADGGAGSLSDESIYGVSLAYPSKWEPGPDFYESRLLKVANCLVSESFVSLSSALESMGCESTQAMTPSPTVLSNTPPTASPFHGSCATEYKRSRSCGARMGRRECCSGLVCDTDTGLCVKDTSSTATYSPTVLSNTPPTASPFHRSCATEYEKSRSCGARLGRRECCSGLVCDTDVGLCVKGKSG